MVAAKRTELSFAERSCGPPGSANGGFACGSIAELLGDDLIAEAHLATVGADVPGVASLAQAQAAAERYPLYQGHPFPACFTCGPERAAGDGLRIFPGPVTGSELWAAPWTPDSSVADGGGLVTPKVVWAALDCPSGFAVGAGDAVMVLGRMAARVLAAARTVWVTIPASVRAS